ncbi:hypothetical protein [Tardiphaga sp.]|jgi:hypothetical protein|uniref:hypothetical protein n=1 Tax=Tardiphaga sp. TaxID=1926292 RepID=UPI0037D9BAE3
MSEDTNRESLGDKALNAAKDTVNAAGGHVDEVGQHFKQKLKAAKRPETYVEMLKDVTKAAPLGMLAVAFIGGMLFARRR